MSTTRLFDQDAYLGEFEATVERSVCEGGMYRVLLDQTAFSRRAAASRETGGGLERQSYRTLMRRMGRYGIMRTGR